MRQLQPHEVCDVDPFRKHEWRFYKAGRICRKCGRDRDEYLAAIAGVPVVPVNRLDPATRLEAVRDLIDAGMLSAEEAARAMGVSL